MMYGSPSYSLGDETLVAAAANAPITPGQARAAKAELLRMKKALAGWLHYRAINDAAAAGQAVPSAFLKRPGAKASTPMVAALRLSRERAAYEGGLAMDLHALLSEIFDAQALPDPTKPGAAVALAKIAISGGLPGEQAPAGLGFIWLWPAVIVAGMIVFVISSKIRNDAETAQEKEYYACVESGHCTDSGFWLKAGAVAVIGWLAWDRWGLREKLTRKTA